MVPVQRPDGSSARTDQRLGWLPAVALPRVGSARPAPVGGGSRARDFGSQARRLEGVHDRGPEQPGVQVSMAPRRRETDVPGLREDGEVRDPQREHPQGAAADRKSTRLNSSHGYISYAVFCLKKKKII